MWRSWPSGRGAPLRGVRQAAVDAADAEAAHGAAAPAAAALGALQPVPQGVPHAQLAQQPQEHLPPAPARRAAAARAARRRQAAAAAPHHRLLQVQRSVQCLSAIYPSILFLYQIFYFTLKYFISKFVDIFFMLMR